MEGTALTPIVGSNGVHYFDPEPVDELANTRARVPAYRPAKRASKMDEGELAAEVFGLFEQRWGVSEIVMALHVSPAAVRNLYRQWRTCLERSNTVLGKMPPRNKYVGYARVSADILTTLLACLPTEQPTRISVAAYDGDYFCNDFDYSFYAERTGFVTEGPVTLEEIKTRYGSGDLRITAFAYEDNSVAWEVFVKL